MHADEEWHEPKTNRDSVWNSYVSNFPGGHAAGLLQEDGQNSFDAYAEGTMPSSMRVLIHYDADARVLRWQDFNTRGMPHCRECNWGRRHDKVPCTNADCPWGAYHNMGFSAKSASAMGNRGMGKSLQLLAGQRTIVQTTLPDGRYQSSEWAKPTGDWVWKTAKMQAPLQQPGTLIETHGVIDRVHEFLGNPDLVVAELQERWFRLLEERASIEYVLTAKGKAKKYTVKNPKLPPLDSSLGERKARLERSKVIVNFDNRRRGELRNVRYFLAKESLPEDRQGIAIVKNGKQTIMRFKDFVDIPSELTRRICGSVDVVYAPDEPFLKEAENATHTGYNADSKAWKAVKRQLRDLAKKFVEPFMRVGNQEVTKQEEAESRELLGVINEALKDVPGLVMWAGRKERKPRELRTRPYLSRIEVEKRTWTRGEVVPVSAIVRNPTDQRIEARLQFEHIDASDVVVGEDEVVVSLEPGSPAIPATATAAWDCVLDSSQEIGAHRIKVGLFGRDGQPLVDEDGREEHASTLLYVEVPLPTKEQVAEDGDDETDEERRAHSFKRLAFYRQPNLAEVEANIDPSQRKASINLAGTRLDYYRRNAKKKASWPIIAEVLGEKLVELSLDSALSEKKAWEPDEAKRIALGIEAGRQKFVRNMVSLMDRAEKAEQKGDATPLLVQPSSPGGNLAELD